VANAGHDEDYIRHWFKHMHRVIDLQYWKLARLEHEDAGRNQCETDNKHYHRGEIEAAEDEQPVPSTHCGVRHDVSHLRICLEERLGGSGEMQPSYKTGRMQELRAFTAVRRSG
jgi:hypothetical protein